MESRTDFLLAVGLLLTPLVVVGPLHLAGVPAEGVVAYGTFGFYLVASALLLRLRGRRPQEIGLHRGRLLGSVVAALLLPAAVLVHAALTSGLTLAGDLSAAHLAERALFCFGFSGPGQEILFRGLLLFSLLRWKGPVAAVAVSSTLYGLAHVRMGPEGMAATALVGAFYGTVAARTGNVWGPTLAHATHNFLFGYVLQAPAAIL